MATKKRPARASATAIVAGVDLGLTSHELREHIIERASDKLRAEIDGREYARDVQSMVSAAAKQTVAQFIDEQVLPIVRDHLDQLTLQATNEWGEKKGAPVTFREYIVQRAEAYLREPVNYDGKPKGTDSFGWRADQTRISHMVHQYLHYRIEQAMKEALNVVNGALAKGIEETVKIKLAEISTALQLTVKTK